MLAPYAARYSDYEILVCGHLIPAKVSVFHVNISRSFFLYVKILPLIIAKVKDPHLCNT